MAKKSKIKTEAGARRAAFFANGGTAKVWAMKAGAGVHGKNKSKAAKSKRACRERVKH